MGSCLVEQFASTGYNVIFSYNNSLSKAKEIQEKYTDSEADVKAFHLNLSEASSVDEFFSRINDSTHDLEVLVNNAAYTKNIDEDDIIDIAEEELSEIMNANIRGTILCMNRFLQFIKKSNAGTKSDIVNISSNSVLTLNASNLVYIACKAAVENLTQSYGKHFGHLARINCVAPGLMISGITKESPEARFVKVQEATPLGRLCTPSDVSETVCSIVNNLTFINGQVITVDGGRTL